MLMKKIIAAVFLLSIVCSLLISCAMLANKDKARADMNKSKALYKSCLIKNNSNPKFCKGLQLAYKADLQNYRAALDEIYGTNNSSVDVSIDSN